ncbi:MAG TPA: biopolymer transporter ExbD [Verrucomicrobiota bacterium]|nr:biopolymer transporter ExbD [Verrucomicrobiales bacterium]HRI14891.1 biopolymer transporter ExbD [Verrucomicrobiota bacterium]
MRRFSQRNSLVTLSEINVTPLLDLAFVLLIIFIITTPLMEQTVNLRLPVGGATRASAKPEDVVLAEVRPDGAYYLKGRSVGSDLRALESRLLEEYRRNPNMVVRIRADAGGKFELPMNIIEICRRNGITRFDIATEPSANR